MEKDPKKPVNDYIKYSGLGFQMLFTILAGVFAGKKLDHWLGMKYPAFTLVLTLMGVGIAMYVVIREVSGKK